MAYGYFEWKPYVPVAERRRKAAREMERLRKRGHPVSPVVIEGRVIAATFWGKAWCDNLEGYADFANRLPRGRTYVRNGSVVDLQIAPGAVTARVAGSELYQVEVQVAAVPAARWRSIRADCAGAVDSLVELLQGRFSKGVMERMCRREAGLFPSPKELGFSCSCPDWASMCKHVAAALYGVGARLDERPELLFRLRQVDEKALIAGAGKGLPLSKRRPASEKVLAGGDLAALFGLEMGAVAEAAPAVAPAPRRTRGVPRRDVKQASRAQGRTKGAARPAGIKESGPRRGAARGASREGRAGRATRGE
jgi:uncharacterized Zn finger protein